MLEYPLVASNLFSHLMHTLAQMSRRCECAAFMLLAAAAIGILAVLKYEIHATAQPEAQRIRIAGVPEGYDYKVVDGWVTRMSYTPFLSDDVWILVTDASHHGTRPVLDLLKWDDMLSKWLLDPTHDAIDAIVSQWCCGQESAIALNRKAGKIFVEIHPGPNSHTSRHYDSICEGWFQRLIMRRTGDRLNCNGVVYPGTLQPLRTRDVESLAETPLSRKLSDVPKGYHYKVAAFDDDYGVTEISYTPFQFNEWGVVMYIGQSSALRAVIDITSWDDMLKRHVQPMTRDGVDDIIAQWCCGRLAPVVHRDGRALLIEPSRSLGYLMTIGYQTCDMWFLPMISQRTGASLNCSLVGGVEHDDAHDYTALVQAFEMRTD